MGSEYLEAFEQGKCGSTPFALSSGRLDSDKLGSGWSWQLPVAGGGEGWDTEQCFVLTKVDSRYQTATPTPAPHPPHCLIEDMLHREEI